MRDRSTLVDLVLAFAATFVITLALWPQTPSLQIVRCQLDQQGWKTYSIAIDDPSLDELKERIRLWKTPESHPSYVTAKWQKEVAEFYEKSEPRHVSESADHATPKVRTGGAATATISDTVTRASYEMTVEDEASNPVQPAAYVESTAVEESAAVESEHWGSSPADGNYWATVKASAVKSMEAIERRSANVPLVFESILPPTWPQLAFHCAFLFGIAAACGYMHWLRIAPVRRGTPLNAQPFAVLARIGTFSGAIAVAMISAVILWVE